MLFMATRASNKQTVDMNQALYKSLYKATEQGENADVLVQDKFGDYQVNRDGNIFEPNFKHLILDQYLTNDMVKAAFDASLFSTVEQSHTRTILTLFSSPKYHYYQYNEYVPPEERLLTREARKNARKASTHTSSSSSFLSSSTSSLYSFDKLDIKPFEGNF